MWSMSPVSSSVISTASEKTCLSLNPMEPVRVTVGNLEFDFLLGLELKARDEETLLAFLYAIAVPELGLPESNFS